MDYKMDASGVIVSKKKIILVVVIFFLLFAGASVAFVLLNRGGGQDLSESQEPQMDFVAEDSRIAGIQVLITDAGLSREQYVAVYKKLNEELPTKEPNSRYFRLVEGSLGLTTSGKTIESLDDIPLVEGLGVEDNTESEPDPEFMRDYDYNEDMHAYEEDLAHDTIAFTMRSESGTEYTVEIYTAGGLNRADVTITQK